MEKISITELIEARGWTDELIIQHLQPGKGKPEDCQFDMEHVIQKEKKIGINRFKFLTKSNVARKKEWTKPLIEEFLGEPDQTRVNLIYRSATPVKLYSVTRISEIELTEAFKQRSTKAQMRSNAMKKSADRRREDLLQRIKAEVIEIPKLHPRDYTKNAIDYYNEHWRGNYGKYATGKEDKSFLQRIIVNYLRFKVSDYEKRLEKVNNQIGAEEARHLIEIKVLEAIGRTYPELKPECRRQIEEAKEFHEMSKGYREAMY